MSQVIIENPILNSPFDEPRRHFKFDEDGITDEIAEGRRPSSYFIPIAQPRKRGKQQTFETQWTQDRAKENDDINLIRGRIDRWRKLEYPDITPVTRGLLEYWQRKDREKRRFFCQIEALETLIYLTESVTKSGDAYILNEIRKHLDAAGTPLLRLACKMATASGKTFVMAMIIAWHTLNKRRYPNDKRFADAFLIVTPGITIRDRLRVLLPSDPNNAYQMLDLVPAELLGDLNTAKLVITNYHAFKARDLSDVGKLTKAVLAQGAASGLMETPAQVVRRVCRELGAKKNIVVLNDEAHHCYRSKPAEAKEKLVGDERREAEEREEAARLWITGLEAVHETMGVKAVYDLSATPFYLRGSGYPEGTLFPWVVSDFSLIDAIECGIVKIPRVPVADNAMMGDQPTYRDLWFRIRDALPRKGRSTDALSGEPRIPKELQGAQPDKLTYYQDFLEPLFWTLASAPGEGGRLTGIPFLNGGLFDDDEFAPTPVRKKSHPPLMVRNATFAGVFDDFLEAFNFTVREDTPLDQDVAVDPEMLGKVFESIVLHAEAADPDAVAPDKRKATGSYYTPRIVVHFICREALQQYLQRHLPGDGWEPRLKELLAMDASLGLSADQLRDVRRLLTPKEGALLRDRLRELKCWPRARRNRSRPVHPLPFQVYEGFIRVPNGP